MASLPFAIALSIVLSAGFASGLRLGLGPERGPRFAGAAVPLAFLIVWAVVVRPGWLAYDALGRVAHVALGALLLGLALDGWISARPLRIAGALAFAAAVSWAESNGTLWPGRLPSAGAWSAFVILFAILAGLVWRLDRLRTTAAPFAGSAVATLLPAAMVAMSVATVAGLCGETGLERGGFILAAAIAGFMAAAMIFDMAVTDTVVLAAAGTLLALSWTLLEVTSRAAIGLALSLLILFAEGTALRVPLPKAGISRLLYPLVLVGVGGVALGLAALVTVALRHV